MNEDIPPLTDEQAHDLIRAASKRRNPPDGTNAALRIVHAVERYYGVYRTTPTCPMCNRPIDEAPCSMNSDGAFHSSHPHNPVYREPPLVR